MITASDLQTIIQFYARDNAFNLTAIPNLHMANVVYRAMVSVLRFGETMQVRDPWTTTVAAQAWIAYPPDPAWIDLTSFEIADPINSGNYIVVPQYRSEEEWTAESNNAAATPKMRRVFGGDSYADRLIYMAPAPIKALNIRVRGTIEPPPFVESLTDDQWRSVFDSKYKDDILALLISATVNINRAQPDLAQSNVGAALSRLKQLAAWTPQVEEQLRGIIGQYPSSLT